MPSNLKLTVAYDGTAYLGWQKNNTKNSIEETLQSVLQRILHEECVLQAASRTDTGVHAKGQIVNFYTHKPDLNLQKLKYSLNCLLPKDIAVTDIECVLEGFHPTLDCVSKEYHYSICYGALQQPQHRLYSWHYSYALDIARMREAAAHFVGAHDFTSFCNYKITHSYSSYIRTIEKIEIVELAEKRLNIQIRGNNFLYRMARNLAGTLLHVGCGKIPLENIPVILSSKDRTLAGITAPAHGLCLMRVDY